MNKLAIVTGGSRGIGRAITIGLIKEGFDVYFTYKKSTKAANTLVDQYPNNCKAFQLDSTTDDIEKFALEVCDERVPDVLVNNVGVNADRLFSGQSLDQFWDILKSNLGSTLSFSHAFVRPMMQKRQGQIINISSVAAIKPKIGNSAYGVSKAGIERFSKTLALEVSRFNVKVNCVAPAYTQTDLLAEFVNDQNRKDFLRGIPMRKVLQPEEVANVAVSLASNKINTTGSVFYLGNGENITTN